MRLRPCRWTMALRNEYHYNHERQTHVGLALSQSNKPASVFDIRIFLGVSRRKQYTLLEKDQTDMTQSRV